MVMVQENAFTGGADSNVALGDKACYPEIDRRDRLSVKEFKHEYLYPNRPVVITDAIDEWRARTEWTMDFFRKHFGDVNQTIWRYDSEDEFVPQNRTEARLADFIDQVEALDWRDYPYYMRDDWRLLYANPQLKADFAKIPYFFDWFELLPSFMRMPYPRLFIGPRGATTPLHIDVWRTHAWLSQFVGRKRWIFFSPDQEDLLYDYDVRVERPDLQKHPRYRDAKPMETTIGPGDTIFAPSGWAHWVYSLDATISLSGNFMAHGCFKTCIPNIIKSSVIDRIRSRLPWSDVST